uniref:C2 domain-containing protein n=1 Tax=Kalanchoe fedtschenkoi TaxID=63787 RepID=A0A7N0V1V9_KALFE
MEVNVVNDKLRNGKRSGGFLGKVKVGGSAFVPLGEESLVYYPLEKRSVFSHIRGEIGLKIWYVDEEAAPPPAVEEASDVKAEAVVEEAPAEVKTEEETKVVDETENEKSKPPEAAEEKPPEAGKTEEQPPPTPTPAPAAPAQEAATAITPIAQSIEKKKEMKEAEISDKRAEFSMHELELSSLSAERSRLCSYDLVDRMPFFFVRAVKAKCAAPLSADSSLHARLVIGTHSVKTKSQNPDKDWDQVFAFDKESLNSTSLEVSVWSTTESKHENDTVIVTEASLGSVSFDLQDVPKRVPPDSPLAPQWYTLEAGDDAGGADVMLAVWIGTQADEAFQEAWQSDSGGLLPETRAKVYLSPKLWYLRLTVIQAQDLQVETGSDGSKAKVRNLELHVKAQLGAQVFKTSQTRFGSGGSISANPSWNEDLVFVAAEPFDPFLILTVEDSDKEKSLGQAMIHVASLSRRIDDKTESWSRWFNLIGSDESKPYKGRIHVRACLEGGYHVLDEAAHVMSDVSASAKQLAKPPIGLLEVGIRGAKDLLPVKTSDGTRGTTDAYVVAKYGSKWVRTRTILDRFNPRWNEQYTWDVYDPCTVLTIGVFDNGRYKRGGGESDKKQDLRIGKLRIRLSTLDTNRAYVNTYSLTTVLPNGAKKMGEIELAVRFSSSSWVSLLQAYAMPMMPRMHYVKPLSPPQQEILRHTAMKVVTARLGRSEPPLGAEVVQFMLDSDTGLWSLRRSKANWFRLVKCLSYVAVLDRWLDGVRRWLHPPTTVMAHLLIAAVVVYPNLLLPTTFMYAFLNLVLRFRGRVRGPMNMDPRLSYVNAVGDDELDEEFDGLPSSRPVDVIRFRYDRLRALAGRAQTLLGDVAAQGERLEALMSWRDPRATAIFAVVCLLASLLFYTVPFRGFILGFGFYYLRHPRFRDDLPPVYINFFRRLPSLSDQML